MEGNYYLCGWKSSSVGFEVWVLKTPKLKAIGRTFDQADESLADKICGRYGDGESKREYVPSPPLKSSRRRFLVSVWGDRSVDVLNGSKLFSKGKCDVCRATLGSRTAVTMQAEKLTKQRENGFFVSSGHVIRVFSRDFVDLIEKLAGARLRWRSIITEGRGEWSELIGGDSVQEVVPKGRNLSGWRCSSCGISRVLAYSDPDGVRSHVAASDFKRQIPGIFAIKHFRGIDLGMTGDLWTQVRTKAEAKGLMSKPLGLVTDEDISTLSELRSYEAYQADPHPVIS